MAPVLQTILVMKFELLPLEFVVILSSRYMQAGPIKPDTFVIVKHLLLVLRRNVIQYKAGFKACILEDDTSKIAAAIIFAQKRT